MSKQCLVSREREMQVHGRSILMLVGSPSLWAAVSYMSENILSWKKPTRIIKGQLLALHRSAPRIIPCIYSYIYMLEPWRLKIPGILS